MADTALMLSSMEAAADAALDPHHAALVSIAVSLKRIADRLDTVTDGMSFASLDNQLWQLGQTFGRGLEIGSRS